MATVSVVNNVGKFMKYSCGVVLHCSLQKNIRSWGMGVNKCHWQEGRNPECLIVAIFRMEFLRIGHCGAKNIRSWGMGVSKYHLQEARRPDGEFLKIMNKYTFF